MSVEFDTPANRIIQQLQPKNKFLINTSLPDLAFLRQLSVQGRLRTFSGSNSTADPSGISIFTTTPANGATLFVYSIEAATNGAITSIVVNWGTETRLSIPVVSTGVPIIIPYFDSFVGDGSKILTVTWSTDTAGTKSAILLGWTENTSRIRDVAT